METKDYLSIAIRSCATAFPVGSSIVNGWNEIQSKLESERINTYVDTVAKRVERLEHDILKSKEDMSNMFFASMSYVAKDPQSFKVPLYASCLLRYGTTDISAEEIFNLIQQLESIDNLDIETLKMLNPAGRIDSSLKLDEDSSSLLITQRQISIKKLESKALIAQGGTKTIMFNRVYKHPDSWPYNFFEQEYVVLKSGKFLLDIWDESKNA